MSDYFKKRMEELGLSTESSSNNTKVSPYFVERVKALGLDESSSSKSSASGSPKWSDGYLGWRAYQNEKKGREEEREARKKAEEEALANESFWDKIGRWMGGGVTDTTIPLSTMPNIVHDMSKTTVEEAQRQALFSFNTDNYTDEQKEEFGRLYMEDIKAAAEYAKAIELGKAEELATKNFGMNVLHTAGSVLTSPITGMADFLHDLAEGAARGEITTKEASPFEYSQAGTQAIAKSYNELGTLPDAIPIIGGKGLGDAYSLGTSIAQSALSAATGGGLQATATFFGSAAASGVDDALKRGATSDQAIAFGFVSGFAEAAAEYLPAEMLLGSAGKSFFKSVRNQMIAEGIEEGATSLATNIADDIINGENSQFNHLVVAYMGSGMSRDEAVKKAWVQTFEDVAFDSLAGAASGGVSGSVFTGASTIISDTQVGKNIINEAEAAENFDTVSALKSLAYEMAGEKKTSADKQLANTAGKINYMNLNARQVGKTARLLNESVTSQNKADIQKALVEKGLSKSEAKRVTELLTSNESLSKKQQAEIEGNEKVAEVVKELVNDPKSSVNQRNLKLLAWRLGVNTKNAEVDAKSTLAGDVSLKNDVDVSEKVSDDGKTVKASTGEAITIDKKNAIAKMEVVNGERVVYFNTDQGVVESTDVNYASEEDGLLYEAFTDMNPAFANAVIKNYDGSVPVQTYIDGMREGIVLYGMHNFQAVGKDISKSSNLAALSETDQSFALKLGRAYAKANAKKSNNALKTAIRNAAEKAATEGKTSTTSGRKGSVRFDNGAKAKTKAQKRAVSLAHHLSKAIGIDIVFYDAMTTKDKNGKGANGYFDPKTNSIHLDLQNAVSDSKTIVFTMSHELVHFIKKWSPAKFNTLANFLMEQYAEHGVSTSTLLANKMAALGTTDADFAYEEMIADACERMLLDSNAVVKLMQLRKTDLELFEKIKLHVLEILGNIRDAFKGIDPNTDEGIALQKMEDVIGKLHEMFEDAAVDAAENYNAIGARNLEDFSDAKNMNGEPLFQYKAMAADENTYKTMLKKWGKMTDTQIDNLFATIDKAMDIIKDNLEVLDYAWEADIDDRAFSPVKPNSDKLYQVSLDFSTLCRKRILQQTIQAQLQEALNKPLTKEEGIAIRDALIALQEEGRKIEVACALCYVESARMKSPEQIKRFVENKENVIKEFFAGKSGGDIKAKIAQAEADAKEKLHRENPNGIKGKDGSTLLDPRTARLKNLPKKYAEEIRAAKRQAKESYKPTAEEQRLIDAAMDMTVSDFTSPEGLENLAKNYPKLFDAYTSYIRNATKSKGIENDTWWRAGDSMQIGDVLIANMNRENGLRSQSWSDFQVVHILDYIAATIELATRNAKEQAYTKVPDYAELMGNTGVMINLSLIPPPKFNGTLDYDSVEGMDYKRALQLRDKYHATVGTICIGVNNAQIKLLLGDITIDYVIPYHKSGMSAAIRKLMHIPTWDQYEEYQSEKNLSRADALKQANKYGVSLLAESDPNYRKSPLFSEWFDIKEAQQIAKMENSNPSDKAKQKKYGVMYGGYMAMQNAANNYLKLCAERGITPKFSHKNADFTTEENYWKLLIDRKMVDNITGDVIEQQTIKPIFDEGEVLRILNDELERYPGVKEDQDYAIRKVAEEFLSGNIKGGMSAEAIAKVMKTPVDNVTEVNILASNEGNGDTEVKKQAKAAKGNVYDYSKSFADQIDDYKNGLIPQYDTLLVSGTPDVWKKVGFNALPVTINQTHVDYALNGTKDADHHIGEALLKNLPNAIQNPVAIIQSQAPNHNDRAVVILKMTHNGKNVIGAIEVDGFGMTNSIRIDSNAMASILAKTNALTQLNNAISNTVSGKVELFYWNKKEAITLLQGAGHQLSGSLPQDGFVHSIHDNGSNVKTKFKNVVETQQFKRWFGDWQNNPKKASKVVNDDGTPMVVYHGSKLDNITTFQTTNANGTGGLYLSTNRSVAETFAGDDGKVYETYVNLRKPLIVDANGAYYDSIAIPAEMVGSKFAFGGNTVDTNAIAAYARQAGYDGVIIKNVREVAGFGDDIIAFEPEQIKSATDNIGTFDPNNPDIRYQKKASNRDNVGYHAGDLGKAEYYHQQGYGRGTGHFGTGTYFVGEEEKINSTTYGNRPHHAVDFSDYKLYKIKSDKDGYDLHEQLKVIDGGLSTEWLNAAFNDEFRLFSVTDGYTIAREKFGKDIYKNEALLYGFGELAKRQGIEVLSKAEYAEREGVDTSYEWLDDDYLEYLKDTIEKEAEKVNDRYGEFRDAYFQLWLRFGSTNTKRAMQETLRYQQEINPEGERNYFAEKDKKADSLATVFMKSLGYEGIDVRGTRLDNTEYGSVIYDLKEDSVLYQKKAVSNRTLLANALENAVQNDIERNKLAQYKSKIELIESEQAKLAEVKNQANEIRFTKGRTAEETKRMRSLEFEANQIANRITTYDRQLLNLEASAPLKNVLLREKEMARKRAEQKGKEALKKQRERESENYKKLLAEHQESRKKAIEGRHKTEMRHKIKKVVGDLNNLLLHPTKDKHVPIGLQLVVADALDAINMDTMNAAERVAYYNDRIAKSNNPDEIEMLTKKRDFFEYRDMNFKDKVAALKNAYAEFKNSDDPLIRNAHNEAIANLIENTADAVGKKSLKDMSYEQLEAVYNMYKAVLATVRNANKMFKEGKQETITESSEAVKREVKAAGGHRDRVLKATKFLKKFGWQMLKPVTAMKVIGSNTFASLFDHVRAGEDTWAVDVSEAKAYYNDVSAKYKYKDWDLKKRYTFKDSVGNEFSLSLEQIMSLYAYSKREQADKHLEVGGFIFDDAIEVTDKTKIFGIPMKYEVNDANPYRLRREDLNIVVEALTAEQKGFVDEMQRYLSEVMGEKGNEVSLAMYDIKLYNEKNYFPLKTSKYFREFDPEKSATPKVKNAGFSKKTVPQAGNPIVLSNFMDVWATHVNDMSMYHAFVLPLEDFTRVYNYSSTAGGYDSVQQYIKNAYGSQANQYIERLLDDLNGGARVAPEADAINKGISLFKKASVFASASVVIQQPSAIARAFAYINPKYFATATGSALNLAKHKELWAEAKKYAPVAVIKEMGYFDTGIGRSTVDWIKGNQTIMDKADDMLSKAPAIADELAWAHIWLAVKREVKATTNLKEGSEEFLKKAGARFTEVIVNTQVYDSVLSRSGMMRSKDTGVKMVTAFMAEPTTTANMMIDGIIQGKRGNKKFLAATVGGVAASIVLNSILVALVYAARDDDEDETYAEKYIGSLTSELIDGFNPLTYIPLIKDFWSIAQGYDVERNDMTVVSNLWESIERIFNEDTSGWEKVADVSGAVSSLFGIPLKNIIRDAKGLYNLFETVTSGIPTTEAGIGDAVEDAFKSSIPLWDRFHETETKSDKLYEAIMSGDQAQIDRIKGRYEDEDAVESAIRSSTKDAYVEGELSRSEAEKLLVKYGGLDRDEAYWKLKEWDYFKQNGTTDGYSKYSDFYTAVQTGRNLKSVISEYTSHGVEAKTLASQITSYFKPLYKKMSNSERASLKGYLLNAYVQLGYNRADKSKDINAWLKD